MAYPNMKVIQGIEFVICNVWILEVATTITTKKNTNEINYYIVLY